MTHLSTEVRTHLNREDKPFLGLTVVQLLRLAIALLIAWTAFKDWAWLPLAPRLMATLAVLAIGALLAVFRYAGRGVEQWVFVALRYKATPRYTLWRPRPPRVEEWQIPHAAWAGAAPLVLFDPAGPVGDGTATPGEEDQDEVVSVRRAAGW